MISKVSNGEMRIDPMTGEHELFKGPGTLTSDSMTKDIKGREGILQPDLFPDPIKGMLQGAMAHVDEVEKKYKHSDELDLRMGTGSIARTTRRLNEQNKRNEAGESLNIVDYAMNMQPYARAAKCGKDMPSYSGGKPDALPKMPGANKQMAQTENVTVPSFTGEEFDKAMGAYMASQGFDPGKAYAKYYEPKIEAPTRSSSWGGIGNAIASGLTALGGLSQILQAKNQSLNRPTTYAPNQYERQALTTMASRRANVYPQLQAMRDAEARNRWAIRNSGGLTGAQKYLANVASGIGLQRNYANVIDAANQLNNQYKGEWANAALQVGSQNAQRMQNSNQYRDEAYAKAHGARTQMEQVGMFNMLNAIQQFYANEFKRHQFERTMGLYDQDYRYNKSYV